MFLRDASFFGNSFKFNQTRAITLFLCIMLVRNVFCLYRIQSLIDLGSAGGEVDNIFTVIVF